MRHVPVMVAMGGLVVASALGLARPAAADPGEALGRERARLATISTLRPLQAVEGEPNVYSAVSVAADSGSPEWSVGVTATGGNVMTESVFVHTMSRPYEIVTAGQPHFVTVFGQAAYADLRSAAEIATNHDDPDITTHVRRGARFAYRIVDDVRNGYHLIAVYRAVDTPLALQDGGFPAARAAASAPTAALYAVSADGSLDPIVEIANGAFHDPSQGATVVARVPASSASMHLIVGGRTIATTGVIGAGQQRRLALPASLHLGRDREALASPTLNGTAHGLRRDPTSTERRAALDLAAVTLRTSVARLTRVQLTAMDLGHGTALIGTLNLRGTSTPRIDKRLFFVAERSGSTYRTVLANVQSIAVSEPLLEEIREQFVDAIDLGDGSLSIVTLRFGYDAHSYTLYKRTATGFAAVYSGGGIAL